MKHFKSLTKIKEASVDEIVEVGVPSGSRSSAGEVKSRTQGAA